MTVKNIMKTGFVTCVDVMMLHCTDAEALLLWLVINSLIRLPLPQQKENAEAI